MPFENPAASPQQFMLCHGFGCSQRSKVSLSQKEWKRATNPLRKTPKTANQERKNLLKSMALIETAVQQSSGLSPDFGGARTFENDEHQMDCLDETINASQYLKFIAQEHLLKFHTVADPVHRGYFVDGMWPHNSAAIHDSKTGEIYAIDTYYSDNGGKAYAVDLDTWLNEWRPEGLKTITKPPMPQRKPKFKH